MVTYGGGGHCMLPTEAVDIATCLGGGHCYLSRRWTRLPVKVVDMSVGMCLTIVGGLDELKAVDEHPSIILVHFMIGCHVRYR